MRRFLARLSLFLLLQLSVLPLIAFLNPIEPDDYLMASVDKWRRLSDSQPPRLLFVGGSGVALGMDSDCVGRVLGRTPINLALHAALGIHFILGQVPSHVLPGDLVVVSLEYAHFGPTTGDTVLWELLRGNPGRVRDLSFGEVRLLADRAFAYLGQTAQTGLARRTGRLAPERLYRRSSFDEAGDMVAHLELPSKLTSSTAEALTPITDDTIGRTLALLHRFAARVQERGGRVVYSFPPVPEGQSSAWLQKAQHIHRRLREADVVPVLDQPGEMLYPAEEFFDTTYHLRRAGVERRCRHLIERLAARP